MKTDEIMRKQQEFLQWAARFTPELMRLHQIGFKGYIIQNDGTIETIYHDFAKRQIDMIHEYIKSRKPSFD